MDDGVIIRRMTEADLGQAVELELRCFSVPWTRGMLEEELANEHALYLAAAAGEQILGYAGAWLVFEEGHITNIAVDPNARRKGIGRLLLTALLEGMQGGGVTSATLEVRRGNAAAIALYASFGFTVEGIRRGYYPDNHEDALIMWIRFQDSGMQNPIRQGG